MNTLENINNTCFDDWWDGRRSRSFFSEVYREGDNSREGHLWNIEMDVNARTIRECDIVIANLTPHKRAHILDCPSGYGRHTLELSKRGYNVTGLDLCPSFIAEAKQNAINKAIQCTFIEGDMRNMPFASESFDYAINMFLSFGFFSDEDNQKTLMEFSRVLKKGGQLLIHTDVNPSLLDINTYSDRTLRHLADGGILHIDEYFNRDNNRLEGCWKIDKPNGNIKHACYSVRIYRVKELQDMAQRAGFSSFKDIKLDIIKNNLPSSDFTQEVVYIMTK